MGNQISYADATIAAYLIWMRTAFGSESAEWKDVLTWQDGKWAIYMKEFERFEQDNDTPAVYPSDHPLSIQEIPYLAQCYPTLSHVTTANAFTPYSAPSVPPEMDEVVLILHSSGSTGFPKPIPHTNQEMLGWCALGMQLSITIILSLRSQFAQTRWPTFVALPASRGCTTPPFHTTGLTFDFLIPLSSLTTVSLCPSTSFYDHAKPPVVPTSDNIIEHCELTGVTGVFAVPSFVETWASEPESVEWLKAKDFLGFGGGPLSVKTGDALSRAGVRPADLYGMTEIDIIAIVLADTAERSPEDWSHMQFSDKTNVRWAPQADGSFESQFLDTEVHRVSVYNLPDTKGYASNDCWVPRPTKPNFWRMPQTFTPGTQSITQPICPRRGSTVSGNSAGYESATSAIEEMIMKYSADIKPVAITSSGRPVDAVVLITGTTGALGSYMLEALLKDSCVKKVYAYNRPARGSATVQDRQTNAFEAKGLLLQSSKLVYVEGDTALPKLGISDALYEEPNICGTRNLVDLALRSSHASTIRFMFTSSICSTLGWDRAEGAFPEQVQMDVATAVGSGYGEGKYVSERILHKSSLQVSSFRIGQITGGIPNGAWATYDWVPSMVKSSLALCALHHAQGGVAWLPMHIVSQAILDVAFADAKPRIALNIVHPRPSPWTSIVNSISEALQLEGVSSEPLPLSENFRGADELDMDRVWFRGFSSADILIRQSGRKDVEAGGMSTLSTTQSQIVPTAIGTVHAIGAEDAKSWVNYWIFKRSSDGVLFKVHRKNLEVHSDIFAAADSIATESAGNAKADDVVPLSEHSSVLELLLQYMYRQPQPDLKAVEFEKLADLAEAAEKYQVFSAIAICNVFMRSWIGRLINDRNELEYHPLEVLVYAFKHDYSDLLDKAAVKVIAIAPPVHRLASCLPSTLFVNWVCEQMIYFEHWTNALNGAHKNRSSTYMHRRQSGNLCAFPPLWPTICASVATRLAGQPNSLTRLDDVFKEAYTLSRDTCETCHNAAKGWHAKISESLELLPSFGDL
ncbi:hypothetical protein FIBSPDRAFT_939222 [Athelia psychrophila]|uniref:BTB domain-containing protein n=1 Tax=Athelia psychrophila TaxID=1759441 RepID=A0A165WXI7_9AGAM|nr:hypothetical protein FIBSPDRAFT_939222 [Fibularhizoctonia sp. CBS 109695]